MKRIIICCDGTWNEPGTIDKDEEVKTNVQRIFESVAHYDAHNIVQIKYYISGVGTCGYLINKLLGGATGVDIDQNIKDAYKFVIGNYDHGDEIYLFGFSRGAYTARSVAGLIRNSGVLKPEYLNKVEQAYKLYRSRKPRKSPDSEEALLFKSNFCVEEPPIKFIGIWDTVGALGVPLYFFKWLNRKLRFHDVKLSSKIQYAYHALAIDEKRKAFQPTLWELTDTVANDPNHPQKLEQVWFPGVHSNVGGGYKETGLSNISLNWMIEKAKATGLAFNEQYLAHLELNSNYRLRNSLTGIYRFMPKRSRAINKRRASGRKTNEYIHYSCFEFRYTDNKYKPRNVNLPVLKRTAFYPQFTEWRDEWKDYLDPEWRDYLSQEEIEIINNQNIDNNLKINISP